MAALYLLLLLKAASTVLDNDLTSTAVVLLSPPPEHPAFDHPPRPKAQVFALSVSDETEEI